MHLMHLSTTAMAKEQYGTATAVVLPITSCGLESSPAALSPTVGLAMEATMPMPTQAGMAKLTL